MTHLLGAREQANQLDYYDDSNWVPSDRVEGENTETAPGRRPDKNLYKLS